MKLLDAMARELPVVTTFKALAGLEPEGVARGPSLASALPLAPSREDARRARLWLEEHRRGFLPAYRQVLSKACETHDRS